MRTLADQSKNANSQVKTILDDIQKAINTTTMVTEKGNKRVESGMQLSAQSNESIERLANAIDQSAQIAAQAMQNISQAEQSARNLHELARRLSETVAQYRVCPPITDDAQSHCA